MHGVFMSCEERMKVLPLKLSNRFFIICYSFIDLTFNGEPGLFPARGIELGTSARVHS